MIASELAGRKLLPGDIIATEAGDSTPPAVAEQPEGQEQTSVFPPNDAPPFEERCGVHFSRPSRAHLWRWPAIAGAGVILLIAERLRRA